MLAFNTASVTDILFFQEDYIGKYESTFVLSS
jgi:hypothetical protein